MKVLLIEDDHLLGSAIKKGLEQEMMLVEWVNDGTEGLDRSLEEEYDMIVLDRMLPGIDGVSICKELRAAAVFTPILMLTALSETADKVTGLTAGADDYLSKPFAFAELLARLKALARRPQQLHEEVLIYQDLELNRTDATVRRDSKTIVLSKKEFLLLEFFMSHIGVIHSKDSLIRNLWEFDSTILPNTVEAFIKSLRKKIELPFPDRPALIYTVRGFGYRFGEK